MAQAQLDAGLAGRIELGRGRSVNRFGFGAMRITGPGIWGEPPDPDEARGVLRRALEVGVELIDTAHAYGPEVSERLIGEALHPYPDELVIATKTGLQRSGPDAGRLTADPRRSGGIASAASRSCAASGSISCSCIASTRQCRSRSRSARSPRFGSRARST